MALTTLNHAAMPSGSVLQVINGRVTDDRDTTTSTSFTKLGDTLDITPKFSSSKIFILAVTSTMISSGGHTMYYDFGKTVGGSTTQNLSGASGGVSTMNLTGWNTTTFSFLDSPSTTNAISYFCSVKVSAGTGYFNDNSTGNYSNFTLMEIAV